MSNGSVQVMAGEWFAILGLLLVVIAMSAITNRWRLTQRRSTIVALGLIWLGSPMAVMLAAYFFHADVAPAKPITNRPEEVLDGGYVGADTCLKCHPSQHASWHDSYHRTMTQIVHPSTVLGEFDAEPREHLGVRFQFGSNKDEVWVDVSDTNAPLGSPGAIPIRKPIVMSTGSHHMQVYWFPWFSDDEPSGYLGMLPFAFHRETARWIPRQSAFLTEPELEAGFEVGRWNDTCLHCHATASTMGDPTGYETDPKRLQTRAAEFGITCEACHGPGEKHIRNQRSPLSRYQSYLSDGGIDDIVNPARLPHDRSSQVCGQCHSVFGPKEEEGYREARRSGYNAYRPGDDLNVSRLRVVFDCCRPPEEYEFPLLREALQDPNYIRERFWSDGMVRVAGREYNGLIDSPCYQRGTLSCLSCHQLHQSEDDLRTRSEWADDQLRQKMETNEACTQCHESLSDENELAAHSHHEARSSGSLCYNCHMPHTTYGLLKAIRSHQIDSPDVTASLTTGRPNACNQCHLDKTLAWSATYLDEWYGIPAPRLNEEQESIAASVLWILKGDAGQRALMAWNLGWDEAQDVSGTDWMLPFLSELMNDPYDAVRFIAWRTLKSLEPEIHSSYDVLADDYDSFSAASELRDIWRKRQETDLSEKRSALLITTEGLDLQRFQDLLSERDHSPVNLQE